GRLCALRFRLQGFQDAGRLRALYRGADRGERRQGMSGAMPSRPTVTLKLATSLDGRIATAAGESKWITGEEARAEAHLLRAAHDGVLVGSETVIADDPELTARTDPPASKQPLRIIADSRARTPSTARVFTTMDQGPVAIATLETANL